MITEVLLNIICKSLDVEDYNDLIPEIRSCITQRDNMFSNRGLSESLETGKLIFNKRDKELGFVVGPIALVERNNKLRVTNSLRDFNDEIFLIVSKNKRTDSPQQDYRVRYVKGRDLIPLDVEERKTNGTDDLNKFCNTQCIMECGKDCILYKYKRK